MDVIRQFIEQFHDNPVAFTEWMCESKKHTPFVEQTHTSNLSIQRVGYEESEENQFMDTIAAYYVWRAIFDYDRNLAIVVQNSKSSLRVYHKIQDIISRLPIRVLRRANKTERAFEFDSKSRILIGHMDPNLFRGLTISHLTVVSKLSDSTRVINAKEELLRGIMPMVASSGATIVATGY